MQFVSRGSVRLQSEDFVEAQTLVLRRGRRGRRRRGVGLALRVHLERCSQRLLSQETWLADKQT